MPNSLESVACNLCGSLDLQPAYSQPDELFHPDEWFTVVECKSCGLGFVNPRPTRDAMNRYYPNEFYQTFDDPRHQQRYAEEATYLADITNTPRTLLDVGCANGDFARFMRNKGWSVEGIEIGANARKIKDFPIYNCELPDIKDGGVRYDAITAWAVLEHVHDPMAYFLKASQLLKPNGRFVFLVTDFPSLPSRYLFREDLPRHLYFFSEATVERYLKAAGLRLQKIDRNNRIFSLRPVNWLRHYLYKTILRRNLTWHDLPEAPRDYFKRTGSSSLMAKLVYVLTHPFAVIDRLLLPLFELLAPQSLTRGIVTYVATKQND
jgi:SAM-dependent methyltransferase